MFSCAVNKTVKSFLTSVTVLAHAKASIEPSDALPEMDLSRMGEFGFEKFQISMEVSARESANNFLPLKDWFNEKLFQMLLHLQKQQHL